MKKLEKREMKNLSGGIIQHWDGGYTECSHQTSSSGRRLTHCVSCHYGSENCLVGNYYW
jgi:hypothetical protein